MGVTDAKAELIGGIAGFDDLPRTLRREHEARAREAREREVKEREARDRETRERENREQREAKEARKEPSMSREAEGGAYEAAPSYLRRDTRSPYGYGDEPVPAAVMRFDVPFFRLALFFLKAVLAAVPALILLGTMLWFAGKGLQAYFPELVHMKILITFPNG